MTNFHDAKNIKSCVERTVPPVTLKYYYLLIYFRQKKHKKNFFKPLTHPSTIGEQNSQHPPSCKHQENKENNASAT